MTEVAHLYEAAARDFDRARLGFIGEETYLEAIAARLSADAHVLDLGCGTGHPIARYFIEGGFHLTGVDAAPAMIAICRKRFPEMNWLAADMRALRLDCRFGAIVAWDSFFHLSAGDQRAMFPILRDLAEVDALLLFTSGPKAGEAIGDLFGRPLYHASLDRDEYERLLSDNGFRVLIHKVEDPACGGHTVWLAQRESVERRPG